MTLHADSEPDLAGASILVLGAGGMLGRAWRDRHTRAPMPGRAVFLDHGACDITRANDLERAIPPGTGAVLNCAGWTDVDKAETHEEDAMRLNAEPIRALAERCRSVGATLVHYSSDYVFDGRATTPYPVDHPRHPINAYGRSKAAGEHALEQSGADFLLIRTSWLYAAHGENFVRTIARLCREKPSLRVVDDQIGRPTSCDTLVGVTLRLLDRGARGIYHGCNEGSCSWCGFARAIAARMNPGCAIEPCTTVEFPRPAPRPPSSVLDLSKTTRAIGPILPWEEALAPVLARLGAPSDEVSPDAAPPRTPTATPSS